MVAKKKRRSRKSRAEILLFDDFVEQVEDSGHWELDLVNDCRSAKVQAFVYDIRNTKRDIGYIGFKSLIKGWQSYTSSSKSVAAAIEEDGIENFEFLVLATFQTVGRARTAEMWYQMHVDVLSDKYYNHCIGNIKFFNSGSPSEETRMKLSKSLTGRIITEETRRKMSKGQTGRVHTDETKAKLSEANSGEKCNWYGKTGEKCHKYKGMIVGTNIKTGEIIRFCGGRGLKDAGFTPGTVYKCINHMKKDGSPRVHKGHIWTRDSV